MTDWWEFGEHSGFDGEGLSFFRIRCAFCGVPGNFELVNRCDKQHSISKKILHFDTYKCGNCANFLLVFWSGGQSGSRGLHNFKTVPWALKLDSFPEHWPAAVGRNWLQAKKSLADRSWDAAAVMARASMQAALREQKAKGKNLLEEIEDLAAKGILPPVIKDWSHELPELGNEAAHPKDTSKGTESADATEIVYFLDFFLEYVYDLPQRISKYRKRRAPRAADVEETNELSTFGDPANGSVKG